jgi:hypothetical protein
MADGEPTKSIPPPDLLREFMRLESINAAELARRLETPRSYVSDLLAGVRRAGLEMSDRIERVTKGLCPARAWVGFTPRKRRPGSPPKRAA